MRPIISFMLFAPNGFVAGPSGEMNRGSVNEKIFERVVSRTAQSGKRTIENGIRKQKYILETSERTE